MAEKRGIRSFFAKVSSCVTANTPSSPMASTSATPDEAHVNLATETLPVTDAGRADTCESDTEPEADVVDSPPSQPKKLRFVTAKAKPRASKQGFTKAWLTKFEWLVYDPIDNAMHCKLCKNQRTEGIWTTGTRTFRTKSLLQHVASKVSQFECVCKFVKWSDYTVLYSYPNYGVARARLMSSTLINIRARCYFPPW